jgi:hypothetical protein
VSAEDGLHVVQGTRRQDGGGTLADFLGWLQDDEDVAGCGLLEEEHGGANGPGGVDVVAAGVHDAGVRGGVFESRGFLDGEGVDVAADGHDGCGMVPAWYTRDDARSCDALDHSDAEFAEEGFESRPSLVFLPGEFGVLV